MKIIIDPLYNPLYATFYLEGLIKKYGKNNIYFSSRLFKTKKNRGSNFDFIIENSNKITRYSIDFNDFNYLNSQASYDWCDVYGKVNTNWQITSTKDFPKIISLAPSFGVRTFSDIQTFFYIINLLLLKIKWGTINYRKFIGKYKRLYQNRLFYEQYENNLPTDEHYVFHLSTLWYSDEWNKNDEMVNRVRANFIRICKDMPAIKFEGGLLSQKGRSSEELFDDVLYPRRKRMSIQTYIEKTKKSIFVFNTPSFWNCHGWKLGEYLSMGKAIISTPLSNDLPFPLEHGINIHFIKDDSEDELKSAIDQIIKNPDYKRKLEEGAKNYWETYGNPEKSLELLGIK